MPKPKTGKTSGWPARAKSVQSQASTTQVRTMKQPAPPPKSSLHKTHSDTSLAEDMGKLSIHRTNRPSRRLESSGSGCKNLLDIATYIQRQNVRNIVVMTGAGISTPSGIPDFRSPGTGLYHNLQQYKIPRPEAVFDIDYFEGNPRPFFSLAKELYPSGKYRPNYIHYFLRLLHQKGLLLRVYTQNIDGLERLCGIPQQKLVEAHGNFLTASCIRCHQSAQPADVKKAIFSDKLPRCKKTTCLGLVKPDIVFFGEDLPRRFYYYLKDFPQTDLLLVMGTSLGVEPFAGLVDSVRFYTPRILINRIAVGPFKERRRANDVAAQGDIIEKLKEFVKLLKWQDDMDKLLAKADVEWQEYLKENGVLECCNGNENAICDNSAAVVNTQSVSSDILPDGNTRLNSAVSNKSTMSAPPLGQHHTSKHTQPPSTRAARLNSRTVASLRSKPAQDNPSQYGWLPRIKAPTASQRPHFHSQKALYQTSKSESSSSSSSSEESSESSDDE